MASYGDTLNYIFNLRGGEIDLRLHRMAQALSIFGHPERCFRAFHIAGTNGKGSTAAMLHRILSEQGYKVGLYTSPHLASFTERIQVGNQEISREEVVELAKVISDRKARAGIPLTFFEFVTVMALVYFARRKVDVAVVEVGLGGRLDATNLVVPAVSVITTISRDHEAYLGNDLLSIAQEKGGIIKAGVPVICGSLSPDIAMILQRMAEEEGSASYFFNRDFSTIPKDNGLFCYSGLEWNFSDLSLALRGAYQRENAAVVLAALEVAREDFPVGEEAVRAGLEKVFWPGRLEVFSHHPKIILDGAHNSQGIKALVREVRILLQEGKVKLLFGVMGDKNWAEMIRLLATISSEIVLTRVPMDRSADPRSLARVVPAGIPVTVMEDPAEAMASLIHDRDEGQAVLVTGSLYLLGRVRPWLFQAHRQAAGSHGLEHSVP